MTDKKKRNSTDLGLAEAADRISKVLATAPERRHKALEKADADEVAAIQTALDKLVARVPADLRGKLVSVLGAMDVEVDAPFVVSTADTVTGVLTVTDPTPTSGTASVTVDGITVSTDAPAGKPDETIAGELAEKLVDAMPSGAKPYVPGPAARAARGR